jgi:hypothetical protein
MIPHDQDSLLSSKTSSKLLRPFPAFGCLIVKTPEKDTRPASSSHLHDSNYTTTSDSSDADKDNEKDERTTKAGPKHWDSSIAKRRRWLRHRQELDWLKCFSINTIECCDAITRRSRHISLNINDEMTSFGPGNKY